SATRSRSIGSRRTFDLKSWPLHHSGVPPLEAARATDLGRYAEWHDTERLAGNLHRAMAELSGTPAGGKIDLAAAIGDMRTLNGAQPMHCLA
ncbi:MAG: hypothetical protein L0H79_20620, partial [Intrasporangium sp.]|nr:hypothetical protein [Intrasporangium sp.]